jgi:hypothetical protein
MKKGPIVNKHFLNNIIANIFENSLPQKVKITKQLEIQPHFSTLYKLDIYVFIYIYINIFIYIFKYLIIAILD